MKETVGWHALIPGPITRPEEALAFVNECGFCTWGPVSRLSFPNLAEAMGETATSVLDLTWSWKDDLHFEQQLYYGKIVAGQPSFLAPDYLPDFISALAGRGLEHERDVTRRKSYSTCRSRACFPPIRRWSSTSPCALPSCSFPLWKAKRKCSLSSALPPMGCACCFLYWRPIRGIAPMMSSSPACFPFRCSKLAGSCKTLEKWPCIRCGALSVVSWMGCTLSVYRCAHCARSAMCLKPSPCPTSDGSALLLFDTSVPRF
jgi:hypothetical protein